MWCRSRSCTTSCWRRSSYRCCSSRSAGSSRPSAGDRVSTARWGQRSRLVVVQVMVLSLFATLFARLWYLQVVGQDTYQAAAVSNAVRDVDIPAPRGLIVDDQGRPLVANRTSWVVTVNRGVFA